MSAILFLVVTMVTASASEHDELFEAFRSRYKRDYHVRELGYRRAVYADNMNYINAHNARAADGEHTFTLRENQFTDMTNEEFRAFRAGADFERRELQQANRDGELWKRSGRVKRSGREKRGYAAKRAIKTPEKVDWTTKGYVTPVKNQGPCGSDWAFSALGALEGQQYKATGKLASLSVQNLLDCSHSYGGKGCSGGKIGNAYDYIIANHGVDTADSYSYMAKDSNTCNYKAATKGSSCTSYVHIISGDEFALKNAVAMVGPVSAAIDASHGSFQSYSSGVYDLSTGNTTNLNHNVLIVGYGSDQGKNYWLVKNSWGTSWGEKGYIRMARGMNNNCGIATQASYPVL